MVYHIPLHFFLELKGDACKPTNPFKLNSYWLTDVSFIEMVTTQWDHFTPLDGHSSGKHFVKNLKNIKKKTTGWASAKKQAKAVELKNTEEQI